jgi:hypothetical protein
MPRTVVVFGPLSGRKLACSVSTITLTSSALLYRVGPNWPNGGDYIPYLYATLFLMVYPCTGEIDIFEGVHLGPTNQMTLHTQVGCATDISSAAPSAFRTASSASTVGTTDCGPSPTNGGCYFIDKSSTSYGETLNSSGGAVIAMEWTAHGVKICTLTNSPYIFWLLQY